MALPKIIAHRGASGYAPENTLAAFAKAAQLGAKCVEFDCTLTADKEVVIHHDDSMARTAGVERLVSETPLFAIKALEVGKWFGAEFDGEKLPTFQETISLLAALGVGANVEVKPAKGQDVETGKLVAEQILKHWPKILPPPVVSSFSEEALQASIAVIPEVEHALLFEDVPDDWQDRLGALKATAVHCDQENLTHRQCTAFTNAGYPVRVFTVNDPERAAELFEWGVESVFTDYPDRFK
ncbi:glycerophosphodiester phosphodiesterase family protein [Aestuariispira ectoiniformans]|uniref:glycerophosphodiester phosphodiesterase family protein n=1 Tax=Aestuariispira ectoiniformans TaxID=2775080 RepID=UPI00223C2521|nr:glycerophosphodiester phosphodiesterase family protein [Aestuariispira ectoiniformans]